MNEALNHLAAVLDDEHALAVIDHRKSIRAKLTPHAAMLLAKQFARCADPNEAADEMILRGWRGFKPEWIRDRNMVPDCRNEASPEFMKLWAIYPIKDAEDFAGALDAYEHAPKSDHQLMLQAAEWLKASLPSSFDPTYRERAKFVPSLARWIKEKRYESKRAMWETMKKRESA